MGFICTGNTQEDAQTTGWFVGHFMPSDSPLNTDELEVKWKTHPAGEERAEWAVASPVKTISILIAGQFKIIFPDEEVLLSKQGDYVCWSDRAHTSKAIQDSTLITIRWPSMSVTKPPTSLPPH